MLNQQSDLTFSLVKRCTKAEKRNFRLYAGRLKSNSTGKFIQLFELMCKMEVYDDRKLRKELGNLRADQLSNLKRHLLKQLLTSLRLLYPKRSIDVRIREKIDYANILYDKGMYMHALQLLEKSSLLAEEHNRDLLLLEILEAIKFIEERHITRSRSKPKKLESLVDDAERISQHLTHVIQLSNLKINIHGYYIKRGHVRNEEDHIKIQEYFAENLPDLNMDQLTFFEKIYLHQSYMWYHYILLDWEKCLKHAEIWITAFDNESIMIPQDPALYMRGLSYSLTCMYNLSMKERFGQRLNKYKHFVSEYQDVFSQSDQIINDIYLSTQRINEFFLNENYEDGVKIVPEIKAIMQKYAGNMDVHRKIVFNYKIAWLYFGNEDYNQAVDHLNIIINLKAGHLREDIQCYARLTQLIAHYELGNTQLLESLVLNVKRFFVKMQDLNEVQRRIFRFFNEELYAEGHALLESLHTLRSDIMVLKENKYEQRAFQHMEIVRWINNKIASMG